MEKTPHLVTNALTYKLKVLVPPSWFGLHEDLR